MLSIATKTIRSFGRGIFTNDVLQSSKAVPRCFKMTYNFSTRGVTNMSPQAASEALSPEAALKSDVQDLGSRLGDVIRKENPYLFVEIESLRKISRQGRKQHSEIERAKALDDMKAKIAGYDAKTLLGLSRAFSQFLALSNSAENHHRVRRLRERLIGSPFGLSTKPDSTVGVIQKLLKFSYCNADEALRSLCNQKIEIVLTAHPTEVNRRTLLQKYQRIDSILAERDRHDLTIYERNELDKSLTSEILSIWRSDLLRRKKPTPEKEAISGLNIVESVLWDAVPSYCRKLSDAARIETGKPLPLNFTPVQFASWMGGDRDGNPNVKPSTTIDVALVSRLVALSLFKRDIAKLRNEISLKEASPALMEWLAQSSVETNGKEPYRDALKHIEERIDATISQLHNMLKDSSSEEIRGVSSYQFAQQSVQSKNLKPMLETADILRPLMTIYESLCECGDNAIADGNLTDTIRRVHTFGLSLLPLDIRQESQAHSNALAAITTYLGIGDYNLWSEAQRQEWLTKELTTRRPLFDNRIDFHSESYFTESVLDTLGTFDAMQKLLSIGGDSSLGAYVISQCQRTSDILAVMVLQRNAGIPTKLLRRVVPLFETLQDLQQSADTIDALLSSKTYRSVINGKQEVMVGYSDSAKDAGSLASAWALYKAQTAIVDVAKKYGVEVSFFHGKGGTMSRGGNPALFQAILSHPPQTIQGRFRVTEQGEMITQKFGQQNIAERSIDLMVAGVLAEKYLVRPRPTEAWSQLLDKLSSIACSHYRSVIREDPRFVPYFRTATPEQELSKLNVGSRPGKRNPAGGVESLRAIPWVFGWTQTRLNLPSWLGISKAFTASATISKEEVDMIRTMYKEWSWFQSFVDLLEMVIVKSEPLIAKAYDDRLLNETLQDASSLGDELRVELRRATDAVLGISGHSAPQENNPVLLKSLAARNPYVDCLNMLQVELLYRLRASASAGTASGDNNKEVTEEILQDALLLTINGVANGMRNSG